MAEVRWITLCIGLMIATAVLMGSPPGTQLIILLGLLGSVNLFTTLINLAQAWKRDPRFLSAGWLGSIQIAAGAGLSALFSWLDQPFGSMAAWVALSYSVAGIIVVLVASGRKLRLHQSRPLSAKE